MNRSLRTCILILCVWFLLSGICSAKQVFLEDGSILDCESFWRRGEWVVVKVNRDVVLEFSPSELDMHKTFHRAKQNHSLLKKKKHPKRHVAAVRAKAAGAIVSAAPAPAIGKGAKPEHQPDPAPVPAPTAARATAEPAAAPPTATPVTVPAGKGEVQPEPSKAPGDDPALDKAEYDRRTRENAELMAQAIQKKDPELMKKALEAQRSLVQQQNAAYKKDGRPKPEPVWFKYFLMLVVSGLLMIISMWVIFRKAGESGVKSIIPIYNLYVLMQISGKPGWWFILLFIPGVGLAAQLFAMFSLAEKFGRSAAFGVGMALLPMFFLPMLAFGGSEYAERLPQELEFTFSEDPP